MPSLAFSTLSIRVQLIALAILLTLPALGIIVFSGIKERNDDYRKATVESQKLVDNLAEQQKDLMNEAQMLGSLLAELPDVANRTTARILPVISNILKKNPLYKNIIITDAAGTAWVATSPFKQPLSLADRRYFKNAKKSGRFSSGEFIVGSLSQQPVFAVASPLYVRGSFSGVVVIGFDLDILKSVLTRAKLPKNSNYILADHKGIIVSRGSESGRKPGEPILPADLQKMETGPEQDTYEFVRSDGDRRIVSYHKLRLPGEEKPYMYVRGGISIREAVATANRRMVYNIGMLLPFVMIALLLAVFIGKRSITDRVKKLQTASQRFAAGELNTRVSDNMAGGELGELGCAFNEMACSLETKIDELNRSQRLLQEKALLLGDEIAKRRSAQEDLAEKQHLLESLNRTLEDRIASSVMELRQKDQTLIQQNRLASMGEMINNIAHQWRQPLNLIGLIVQGLPDCKNLTQAELDREVDRVMDVILHMSQTIDDFRYFFHQDKKKSQFTANQAVAKAVDFITPSLDDVDIRITVTEQPDITVYGYSNEYAQVLLNILSNARDVLVQRNVAGPQINIIIERENNCSVVTISDNGGGISTDALPKIFDPYFTTKEKSQGTGIGLYMSKMIIEQNMNGKLTAENNKEGATFRIEV